MAGPGGAAEPLPQTAQYMEQIQNRPAYAASASGMSIGALKNLDVIKQGSDLIFDWHDYATDGTKRGDKYFVASLAGRTAGVRPASAPSCMSSTSLLASLVEASSSSSP